MVVGQHWGNLGLMVVVTLLVVVEAFLSSGMVTDGSIKRSRLDMVFRTGKSVSSRSIVSFASMTSSAAILEVVDGGSMQSAGAFPILAFTCGENCLFSRLYTKIP